MLWQFQPGKFRVQARFRVGRLLAGLANNAVLMRHDVLPSGLKVNRDRWHATERVCIIVVARRASGRTLNVFVRTDAADRRAALAKGLMGKRLTYREPIRDGR